MSRGLYIHVPFCVRKCPYCDFFSAADCSLKEEYVKAAARNVSAINDSFSTVYFGGGTPSLLSPEQFGNILSAADIIDGAEISAEANPGTTDEKYLSGIKAAGINRISFGIQSFDEQELKALGRIHSAAEASEAVISARKAGFENISADLMLGTPFQTKKSLKKSLETVVSLPVTHISAYMLKIERNTPIAKNKYLLRNIPGDDETADMYLETVNFLAENGFEQYEISNFARTGYECVHNLGYWHCEEYYGIGPSAHGFVDGERFRCDDTVKEFTLHPIQDRTFIERGGGINERAMLLLRLTKEGLPLDMLAGIECKADILVRNGLARKDNGFLKLTPEGCLVSNEIILFCGIMDNISKNGA